MRKIAMIGSMRYPELLDRAEREFGHGARCRRPEAGPTNCVKGDWHWAVDEADEADEVIVVRKPDGSLGAGTVDELEHAVGTGQADHLGLTRRPIRSRDAGCVEVPASELPKPDPKPEPKPTQRNRKTSSD